MLNETMLLNNLKLALGDDLFDGLDPEWLIHIMETRTQNSFSILYPKIVKGILIQEKHRIKSVHPQTGQEAYYQYLIPNEAEGRYAFINIENYYFPGNFMNDRYTGMMPMLTDTMAGALRSLSPTPVIRTSVTFEPPNIAVLDPIPKVHRDFSLNMQRVRALSEFPLFFFEMFLDLYTADVKSAIYNKFKNARDGATIGGVEVKTFIDEYSSAESDRKELIATYRKDYFKNPERFEAILQNQ